jgi:hypothetical protein
VATSTVFGDYTLAASREMIDTITDPEGQIANLTLGPPLAWDFDDINTGIGWEIGYVCDKQHGTLVGGDGVTYDVQREFSNIAGECIVSAPDHCQSTPQCPAPGQTDFTVNIQCDATPNPGVVQVLQSDGTWLTVGSGALTAGGLETFSATSPAGQSTVTVRVCEQEESPYPTLACTPSAMWSTPVRSCSDLGAQCGTISDGCSGTTDCGTCTTGNSCSYNMCCPSGTQWDPVRNQCDSHPLICKPGFGDCGGYCCKCGPNSPC